VADGLAASILQRAGAAALGPRLVVRQQGRARLQLRLCMDPAGMRHRASGKVAEGGVWGEGGAWARDEAAAFRAGRNPLQALRALPRRARAVAAVALKSWAVPTACMALHWQAGHKVCGVQRVVAAPAARSAALALAGTEPPSSLQAMMTGARAIPHATVTAKAASHATCASALQPHATCRLLLLVTVTQTWLRWQRRQQQPQQPRWTRPAVCSLNLLQRCLLSLAPDMNRCRLYMAPIPDLPQTSHAQASRRQVGPMQAAGLDGHCGSGHQSVCSAQHAFSAVRSLACEEVIVATGTKLRNRMRARSRLSNRNCLVWVPRSLSGASHRAGVGEGGAAAAAAHACLLPPSRTE
jgi:hypothetical protein